MSNYLSKTPRLLVMGHNDGYGGSQTAFRKFVEFLNAAQYEFGIIAISDELLEKLSDQYPNRIIGVVPHKSSFWKIKIKKIFSLAAAVINARRFRPEIFVSVGINNSVNFIARKLPSNCFLLGQDFIADRNPQDKIWRTSRSIFNGMAVQAPAMLDYWRKTGEDMRKLNWLPCFPENPAPNVLKKTNQSTNTIKLGYFGRLAANKGLDLVLTALSRQEEQSRICLDIWGKGDVENQLRSISNKLKLDGQVSFKGLYPFGDEGAALMASYDALVLCSTKTEGLPLILLESMAYGLPIFTTNVGAIVDCCKNNPDTIMVEPNVDAITSGLSLLIQKIIHKEFNAERQHRFYLDHFSHKVMSERWNQFLQNPNAFFSGN